MKLDKTKRNIMIIVTFISLFIFAITAFAIVNAYQTRRDRQAIEILAAAFIKEWYSYDKQSDIDYNKRIRPYMTESFYEATNYINTERPQDFENQTASSGKVTDIKNITQESGEATVMATTSQTEVGSSPKEILSTLHVIKENNKWLVDTIE